MWAVSNGNCVRMFTGHTSMITALECSKNGKVLASADDTGVILLWDLGPGRLLKKMRGHGKGGIWSMSWSAESTVLVLSGGADCTVRSWDVTGPSQKKPPPPLRARSATNPATQQEVQDLTTLRNPQLPTTLPSTLGSPAVLLTGNTGAGATTSGPAGLGGMQGGGKRRGKDAVVTKRSDQCVPHETESRVLGQVHEHESGIGWGGVLARAGQVI